MGTKSSKSTSKTTEEVRRPAEAAQHLLQDFMASVNELVMESQEKAKSTYQDLSTEINDYQLEFQRMKEEEYRRMIGDIQDAFGQDDSQAKIQETEAKFRASLEEKREFLTKGLDESSEKLSKELEKIAAENRKAYEGVFQDFIKGLKKEISGINLKDFDAETLAALGQVMIYVSKYAVIPE